MGLDMYLTAEKFISGYDHNKDENFAKVLELMNLTEADVDRAANIEVTVGYWRKANAIHDWFVQNVQNGKDECQKSWVGKDELEHLLADCKQTLAHFNAGELDKAEEILPPSSGFFFGSTEIDEGYKRDLEHTIKVVEKCLSDKFKGCSFHYQASW